MADWKTHLMASIFLCTIWIFLTHYYFQWYDFTDLNFYIYGIPIILLSSGLCDLDHDMGKLKKTIIFFGLGISSILCLSLFFLDYEIIKWLLLASIIPTTAIEYTAQFSKHRGFIHSIPFLVMVSIPVGMILTLEMGVLTFVGGYSHLLADGIFIKMK